MQCDVDTVQEKKQIKNPLGYETSFQNYLAPGLYFLHLRQHFAQTSFLSHNLCSFNEIQYL